MDLKLTGRTALVTGSSKGIGLAVAQWFAREGVNVAVADINLEEAQATRDDLFRETSARWMRQALEQLR